jgi:hypothetical protein
MIRSTGRSSILGRNTSGGAAHTVPTGRVAFLNAFQAINCLATIIWSLRDKHTCVLMLTRIRGRGTMIESLRGKRFAPPLVLQPNTPS